MFKPLFCEIRYLVYVWTNPTVYALIFTVTNKPRRAGYAVFTCIMYNVICIILVTIINKIDQYNYPAVTVYNRFTNDFSIVIQIQWKIGLSVTPLCGIISLQISHLPRQQLSCHVQNLIAITSL